MIVSYYFENGAVCFVDPVYKCLLSSYNKDLVCEKNINNDLLRELYVSSFRLTRSRMNENDLKYQKNYFFEWRRLSLLKNLKADSFNDFYLDDDHGEGIVDLNSTNQGTLELFGKNYLRIKFGLNYMVVSSSPAYLILPVEKDKHIISNLHDEKTAIKIIKSIIINYLNKIDINVNNDIEISDLKFVKVEKDKPKVINIFKDDRGKLVWEKEIIKPWLEI